MAGALANHKVAIVLTDGFQQAEMVEPRKALQDLGAYVPLISPNEHKVRGWQNKNWAEEFEVDLHINDAIADEYSALVLPGGAYNPDTLRTIPLVLDFVKAFFQKNKPVAAICHGPWTLINAGIVKGRTVTSWPSIRVDLENAGARWEDKEVVVSDNLITSRKPGDLPAFNRTLIGMLIK